MRRGRYLPVSIISQAGGFTTSASSGSKELVDSLAPVKDRVVFIRILAFVRNG
jgi:hypothetical protein